MSLDHALFESLRDAAFAQIKADLKTFVDAAPDPKQLVLVVYVSGEEAHIDASTRDEEIEKLQQTSKATGGENDPAFVETVESLRGRAWPVIPILLIRNEPEELTFFQVVGCLYEDWLTKGGNA